MLEQSPPADSPPVVPEERRRLIVALLGERGSVTVSTVERAFGVSSMTARRDLAILANEGLLRRTHGGAVLPELAGHEDSFRSRLEQDAEQKRRIGRAIAAGAEANETIFVDSSTTSYFAVEELLEIGVHATLLTNSLPVMSLVAAAESSNLKLIGLAGSFRALTQSFVGAETVRAIEGFYADRVVFSVKGISSEGFLTDPDALETQVKRAMISQAATVVLVATGRKFDGRGLNVIAPANRVRVAYLTDPPVAGTRMLAEAGVEIVRV
jgi:DeoR/GlpR family transcriptional regulator of sugar metabolism